MSLWNKTAEAADRKRHQELSERRVQQIDAELWELRVLDVLRQSEGGRVLSDALERHYTATAAEIESVVDPTALMKLSGILNGLTRARVLLRDQTEQIAMLVEERASLATEIGEE